MLLTKWCDVEEWIQTNGFKRVVVRTSDRSTAGEDNRSNDCVFDSRWASGDWNSKIDHLKWMLERSDRKVFATGFQNESAGTGGMIAEIRLDQQMPAQQAAVGYAMPPVSGFDEQAITERIRKEIKAEYEKNELERERKEFERERKEFNDTKNGIMGLVVGYGKPILEAMAAKNRVVAGIDQPGHTEVDPINPEVAPVEEGKQDSVPSDEEGEQDSVFSDEEAEQLMDLMARFKKVEPDYLCLIRSVVEMAESGDATYTAARGFLIK